MIVKGSFMSSLLSTMLSDSKNEVKHSSRCPIYHLNTSNLQVVFKLECWWRRLKLDNYIKFLVLQQKKKKPRTLSKGIVMHLTFKFEMWILIFLIFVDITSIIWRRKWQPSSSILARRIPWTEEPKGLQSMGSQGVGHNWVTNSVTTTWIISVLVILEEM